MKKKLIVQKYGGTCLGTAEKMKAIAAKMVTTRRRGHDLVAVVSAMDHTTDRLMALAREMTADPHRRELDMLLATGETTSMSLLAMAIHELGEEAVSLSGAQCGIITNDVHSNARILRIHTDRLREELARGAIVVAAGYQGLSTRGEVTTLGRGGSDTTATALAAALGADACQIFTDVDSVYSADPRVVPEARPIAELHSDEMEEMAWHGAQVVKAEAVEFAKSNDVDFEVRSPFGDAPGSRICVGAEAGDPVYEPHRPEVAGVSGRADLLRLRTNAPVSAHGAWGELFDLVAPYDLIFGRLDSARGDLDLLLSNLEIPDPEGLRRDLEARFGGMVGMEIGLGAVSLIGFGLGSRPAALFEAFRALETAGFEVHDSFTGRESLSFLVDAERVRDGVRLLHRAFVEKHESRDGETSKRDEALVAA